VLASPFVALALVLTTGIGAYGVTRIPSERVRTAAGPDPASADIYFLEGVGAGYRLASASFDSLDERHTADVRCERAYVAAGRGLCLGGSMLSGRQFTFGSALKPESTGYGLSMPWARSTPSRVRVSPNGRLASSTVFVVGDSYNTSGFSTRTLILDLDTLAPIADLEEFTIEREGKSFSAVDFNFWGVTFAGGDRFYATLGTGGHYYLVQGDIGSRRARVLRDGVECPSLSPDGTKLAYKSRVAEGRWELRVLELATLVDRPLAETRSVDDQVEWLDDRAILYSLPASQGAGHATDRWRLGIDGGVPTLFLSNAFSPAVVRR
jgi:hypothetical protein